MTNIERIIKDIRELKGSTVNVFGLQRKLADVKYTYEDLTIDILYVLSELKDNEVYEIEKDIYDENDYWVNTEYSYLDSDEEIEDYLNSREVVEIVGKNTYNWNCPISNDFNYFIYADGLSEDLFVVLNVNRFGDVRCDYTIGALLKFDSVEHFYEVLNECNKYYTLVGKDGEELYFELDFFGEGLRTDGGEYTFEYDGKEFDLFEYDNIDKLQADILK